MAKNNTSALVLALLIVVGLFSVAAAIVWLGLRSRPNSGTTPTATPTKTDTPKYTSVDGVPLASDREVDYTKLRDYLRQKDWRSADRETYLRMLDTAGPKALSIGFIPQVEMDALSCTDLRTIDSLWNTASNGLQGFTVQMNILKGLGSYRKMYDKVGWQKLPPSNRWLFEVDYNPQTKRIEFKPGKEPNYNDPPPGHLPTVEIGYNISVAFSGALIKCGF